MIHERFRLTIITLRGERGGHEPDLKLQLASIVEHQDRLAPSAARVAAITALRDVPLLKAARRTPASAVLRAAVRAGLRTFFLLTDITKFLHSLCHSQDCGDKEHFT
jgi:hypothetical protein